jgi:O-antigen/teichoic acid export membrane protein
MKINYFNDIKTLLFNNLTTRQTIFKNTFWSTIGTSINKLLGLLLLIYVARILGATEYGKFSFALAFISLFVIFYDFGLPTLVIREYAKKEEEKDREEFYSVLSLKFLLSIVTFVIVLVSSFFITADPQIRNIVLILTVFSIINGFISIFYAVFVARQRMEQQAWLESLQYLLISGFGFLILFNFPSVENLSFGYLAASIISLIVVLIFFSKKIFSLKIYWQSQVWRKFLIMAWPLALTGLFGSVYNYIDSVMMGFWGMIAEIGWYNAAYRIIFVTYIPMALISGSFYPALSNFFKTSIEKLQETWNYQLETMISLALPLVVGGIALAPRIIYSLYPFSFSPSILAFQILILSSGLIFLYRPFYDAMISSNQQKNAFWVTLFGAITNILLNLILIPTYGLYGAAIATVVAYIIILLISIFFTTKFTPIKISYFKVASIFLLAGLSSALMYFVIIRPEIYNLHIVLSVAIGALVYFLSLIILKKITKQVYAKI